MTRRRSSQSPFDLGCATTRLLAQVLLGLFMLVGALSALDYTDTGRVHTTQQAGPQRAS